MQDLLAKLDVEVLMAETQLTASKTNMLVADLDAFGKSGQPVNGVNIYIYLKTLTTVDGSNYFTPQIYQADAKTSTTALTSGELCTSDEVVGVIDVIDDGPTAGSIIAFGYRGVKKKIQIQLPMTGTSDITISVVAVGLSQKADHVSKTDG